MAAAESMRAAKPYFTRDLVSASSAGSSGWVRALTSVSRIASLTACAFSASVRRAMMPNRAGSLLNGASLKNWSTQRCSTTSFWYSAEVWPKYSSDSSISAGTSRELASKAGARKPSSR